MCFELTEIKNFVNSMVIKNFVNSIEIKNYVNSMVIINYLISVNFMNCIYCFIFICPMGHNILYFHIVMVNFEYHLSALSSLNSLTKGSKEAYFKIILYLLGIDWNLGFFISLK